MLDALIGLSIRHRLTVILLAAVLMVWGGWQARQMPVDVFPDLNRPTVTVLTEAGGLSPEEVEALITRPIEAAMGGAPGVERVRSQSAPGLSVVWVESGWSVDIYRARQQVAERLAQVGPHLPGDVAPAMGPVTSIMGEIMLIGLSARELGDGAGGGAASGASGGAGDTVDRGPELRAAADWTIRPRLMAIPGVSQVIAMGGGVEQVQVEVDPAAMARLGFDLEAVRAGAAMAQGSATGGFLERKSQEYAIRALARTADPAELARSVIGERDGVPILLGQVAEVRRGIGLQRGVAGVDGRRGVILSVQKQPGADTLALTAEVEAALAELRPALGAGVEAKALFRQADFIGRAVRNVEEALRDGVVLVALILILFLMNLRLTAITLTAIPLSFVSAAVILRVAGLSVDTMTLGGLAVAIGELVDDAIVDAENVLRRLRENAARPDPRPVTGVIFEASREVRGSIVFSTILIVLVFLPLFSLDGVEGRLFAPLGVAYITSILASLLVSLTVTPAMCAWLLPGAVEAAARRMAQAGAEIQPGAEAQETRLIRWMKVQDRRVLERLLPRPWPVFGAAALLVGAAALSVPWLGRSFLPPFNEGTATISFQAAPGTSLSESEALGLLAERLLLEIPEVRSTGRRTGRAEADEHAEGVHSSEIDVDFFSGEEDGAPEVIRPRAEVLADIRARLALIPGVGVNLGQPISHRLDHLLSGVRAAVAVKVMGADLGALRAAAERVAAEARAVPGLVDVWVEPQVLVPQVRIEVDRAAAARYGVAPGWITGELESALAGARVGQVFEGARSLDLVVRYAAPWREDPARLEGTPLVLPDGRAIPLGNLARIGLGSGVNQILHEDGQRRVVVSANVAGRDTAGAVRNLQARLGAIPWPAGAWYHIGGQFEQQQRAARRIGLLSLLSLLGMYGVLYAHFRSHALVLQVLLNVPLALVGAVAALWISGQPLSVATTVGFITLCGIATRNTILMISHWRHLMEQEGLAFSAELVIRGAQDRLVPVAMTALCAGLGLLPLVVAGGEPGREILTPVAQVILGGLLSSTLLDMVLTPLVFYHWTASTSGRTSSPAA